MRGWERQTQGYCNNKEKISSPADILQEEERGGINAKKMEEGKKKSEANVGGYSMYTQRRLSSTFKHRQWGVIKQQPDNEHAQINQTRERER